MNLIILTLACALCLQLGFLIGMTMERRVQERVLEKAELRHERVMMESAVKIDQLTTQLVEMQKLGFTAVPSSEGDVWVMDDSYDLQVAAERKHTERLKGYDITPGFTPEAS